jgi:hypothetical protein
MKKFVFIDESIRTRYTMAAVVVPITKVGDFRKEMLNLRTKGAKSFHMGRERRQRQQQALKLLASLDYCEIYASTSRESIRALARQESLRSLLKILPTNEYHVILDHTNQEETDRETILRLRKTLDNKLEFLHLARTYDSGLWGPDIVAWAVSTKHESILKIKKPR